jgi:hypothetical protein
LLLLSMVARSWAAFAMRPAVVRVLNFGLGGGFTGMVVMQERRGGVVRRWDDGVLRG